MSSKSDVILDGPPPPRIRRAPSIRHNSWEEVSDLSASLGVPLYEWQDNVLQAAMGERADGRWAARMVGVSVSRQSGKSQLIVARALAGVLLFNEQTIICAAHQQATSRQVFDRLISVIEANPSIERRVQSVMKAITREHIKFKNGSIIEIKTRAKADATRGFSADCLLLDEAQIFSPAAAAATFPTMAAKPNAQAWLLGTPPTDHIDGEVFTRIRESAIAGNDPRLAWVEWSPEDDADIDDPKVWAATNPTYGFGITYEALMTDRSVMTDEQFWAEHLGGWVNKSQVGIFGPSWQNCQATRPEALPMSSLALASTFDLDRSALVASGIDGDRVHVMPVHSSPGTDWIGREVLALQAAHSVDLVVDPKGPASALIPELERAGVRLRIVKSDEVYAACAGVVEAVRGKHLAHGGYPELDREVEVAKKRPVGDRWAWDRKTGIPILEAATLALWAADNPVEEPIFVSAYEDDGVVVV